MCYVEGNSVLTPPAYGSNWRSAKGSTGFEVDLLAGAALSKAKRDQSSPDSFLFGGKNRKPFCSASLCLTDFKAAYYVRRQEEVRVQAGGIA
jgi:hypothetical protein